VLLAWQLVSWHTDCLPGHGPGDGTGRRHAPAIAQRASTLPRSSMHIFSARACTPGATDRTRLGHQHAAGVVARSPIRPELGYAIIGEVHDGQVYAVGRRSRGHQAPCGLSDAPILDRGGRLERVMLPKQFQGGGLSAATPPAGGQPE